MNKKKYVSRLCAIAMAMCLLLSMTSTAFAETPQEPSVNVSSEIPANATAVYTEEIVLEDAEGGFGITPYSWTSESFVYTKPRRGAVRKFDGNYAAFEVKVTAEDGSTVRQNVFVQFCTYDSPYVLRECTVSANGVTHKEDWIKINNKGTFYFYYHGYSYGSEEWKPMKITMTFYSWE